MHGIWHLTCTYMSIWVSKEALGPQECSQPYQTVYTIVLRAKNVNFMSPEFSNVFFRISFVYIRPIQDFTDML